jgi:hypothetical protein
MCNILLAVNCGQPDPPVNGSLMTILHTREGATVDFSCDEDFIPSMVETATCAHTALWIPAPEDHNCTLVEGRIIIDLSVSM